MDTACQMYDKYTTVAHEKYTEKREIVCEIVQQTYLTGQTKIQKRDDKRKKLC